MSPDISIILPVYNNETSLPTAVESLFAQSYTNWELLIIADGSPPAIRSYLESIADDRVRKFYLSRRGIARTLNFGIRMARSHIIARMDADDVCHQDRLEKQYDFLINHPDTGVVASRVSYIGNGPGFRRFADWQNQLLTQGAMYHARFQDAVVAHPSVMFRKELFHLYGGYCEDPSIPEDFELWLRYMEHGVQFHKLSDELLTWTDHDNRLSRQSPAYQEMSFWKVKSRYLLKHLQNNDNIYVIGRGNMVNKKIELLKDAGLNVIGKVDVRPHPGNRNFITYEEITDHENAFFISLVRDPLGKEKIDSFLKGNGLVPDKDFLLAE